MLKALFLDLDETLCDTTGANLKARDFLADFSKTKFGFDSQAIDFASDYLTGIYKVFDEEMKKIFLPITNEEKFRTNLLRYLLNKYEFKSKINDTELDKIREDFDQYRMDNFDFFPGVRDLLSELRQSYTLVVITNGPTYSQHPKVDKVGVREIVDHVIIGGEEPEEKPFKSIFMKACGLANCKPKEAIHVGDSLAADISGAVNAGIKSVWISPEEKHDSLPDHIITNFIMIPSILDHYKNL